MPLCLCKNWPFLRIWQCFAHSWSFFLKKETGICPYWNLNQTHQNITKLTKDDGEPKKLKIMRHSFWFFKSWIKVAGSMMMLAFLWKPQHLNGMSKTCFSWCCCCCYCCCRRCCRCSIPNLTSSEMQIVCLKNFLKISYLNSRRVE